MKNFGRLVGRLLFWLAWPALYVYMRRGARTRVLVIAGGEQVALVRGWLSAGGWVLPGGGLHPREEPRAGATREAREETGLMLEARQLVLLGSEWQRSHGLKAYLHFFLAEVDAPAPLRRQKLEIAEATWFRLDKLPGEALETDVCRALELSGHR